MLPKRGLICPADWLINKDWPVIASLRSMLNFLELLLLEVADKNFAENALAEHVEHARGNYRSVLGVL